MSIDIVGDEVFARPETLCVSSATNALLGIGGHRSRPANIYARGGTPLRAREEAWPPTRYGVGREDRFRFHVGRRVIITGSAGRMLDAFSYEHLAHQAVHYGDIDVVLDSNNLRYEYDYTPPQSWQKRLGESFRVQP